MLLKTSACGGRRGVASGSGAIRGTDVEGNVEGFTLGLVMRFFGAAAEVCGIVPLRVALEMRVCLLPDCARHGFGGGE